MLLIIMFQLYVFHLNKQNNLQQKNIKSGKGLYVSLLGLFACFFTCEDAWVPAQVSRQVVESPSLEVLKSNLDMVLGGPAGAGGLDQVNCRDLCQPQPFCDSPEFSCVCV